jgi:hypothetical protein
MPQPATTVAAADSIADAVLDSEQAAAEPTDFASEEWQSGNLGELLFLKVSPNYLIPMRQRQWLYILPYGGGTGAPPDEKPDVLPGLWYPAPGPACCCP